ncbi:MAG: KOW domain-containing RNA-binding protein [Oscillospiraceae bacterium]|jgi:ribosomal protein L14E/L6E/L27E|nr:KOW domain-containing RNA-binding protein [Oscillospiraceae bacterium]
MFEQGTVVRSVAGRDKGYLLCVVGEESGCILVCDGKERPLQRPKHKNPRHVERLAQVPALTWELRGNQALRKALNQIQSQEPHSAAQGILSRGTTKHTTGEEQKCQSPI